MLTNGPSPTDPEIPGAPQPGVASPLQEGLNTTPGVRGPRARPDDMNPERWLNGITYRREPCGVAGALPVGCTTGHAEESPSETGTDDRSTVKVDPFLVYVDEQCSTFGFEANDYIGRAERLLAASEAYAVEKEFWTGTQAQVGIGAGVDYPNDQWLAQTHTCTTLAGGVAQPLATGIGLLQQAIGDTTGGSPGMIHVPPAVLPGLQEIWDVGLISASPTLQMVDHRQNIIVPGFGYSANTGPSGAAAPSGQHWLYATGMVYIRRTDVVVTPDRYDQALDRTNNEIAFRAQRYYLVDWDRCVHFAVLTVDCNVC